MNENEIIPSEMLKELLASRGMVLRQKQHVSFEDGMKAIKQIGNYLIPGFTIDQHNEFAYANMLLWCINDANAKCIGEQGHRQADLQKGVYVYGNVGTGKSLMLDIFRTFCRAFDLKAKFGEEVKALAWSSYRADDICDQYGQDGDMGVWKNIRSLCIQDLGTEPAEILYMGNRRRVMRSIIEARGDMYDRLTLVSSNIPPQRLGEVYGPRAASRIVQMCNFIRLDGPDRRK